MSVSSMWTVDRPNPRPCDRGINFAGYLRTESGVGSAARRYVRALESLHLPVALADLSSLQINRSEDQTLSSFDQSLPYDVNLVCADVELHFAIMRHLGEEFFRDHYNVGIWAWELLHFPTKWHDRFAYYDEIWVGTSFIANALAPVSPVPVVRIPPVLAVDAPGCRAAGRRRLGVADDELTFLFMFDFHSHAERKNPLAVVDAFRSAFRPDDRARLFVKCVNEGGSPADFAALRERAMGHRVHLLPGYWPANEVQDLVAACDVYVSLHRSEGTGLTITDAMAHGKPVIATGWSGNMDVMNVANSFPVRYDLVEIAKSAGPYDAGQVWAEPSVEHAAALMRAVYEDRAEAERVGARARQDVESAFGVPGIADLIQPRLEAIDVRRRMSDFQRESWTAYREYQQLGQRLAETAHQVVPRDATVLVVSKGDPALLQLDGPTCWHFPRADDGAYAGYYPADSAEAIAHLEVLRQRGGQYLLLPNTALWWLEHYTDFRAHLDSRYRRVVHNESCIIYDLSSTHGSRAAGPQIDRNAAA
jgi:glycosyltransferase involved in cell wall biosynthesis